MRISVYDSLDCETKPGEHANYALFSTFRQFLATEGMASMPRLKPRSRADLQSPLGASRAWPKELTHFMCYKSFLCIVLMLPDCTSPRASPAESIANGRHPAWTPSVSPSWRFIIECPHGRGCHPLARQWIYLHVALYPRPTVQTNSQQEACKKQWQTRNCFSASHQVYHIQCARSSARLFAVCEHASALTARPKNVETIKRMGYAIHQA
ncbi:hypothetical protein BKA63DRAFT_48327 [Paraphoma chrysanthemicola]|nr:hypothetical protein BKA63DRAFT_48327 [Paraphoma chrysanthemicola]